jgi:hypothetical protein
VGYKQPTDSQFQKIIEIQKAILKSKQANTGGAKIATGGGTLPSTFFHLVKKKNLNCFKLLLTDSEKENAYNRVMGSGQYQANKKVTAFINSEVAKTKSQYYCHSFKESIRTIWCIRKQVVLVRWRSLGCKRCDSGRCEEIPKGQTIQLRNRHYTNSWIESERFPITNSCYRGCHYTGDKFSLEEFRFLCNGQRCWHWRTCYTAVDSQHQIDRRNNCFFNWIVSVIQKCI